MPGQPFDRIAVLYNYLFHNTSKGHTVAVADILTNYRNHGYELEIKSFYRDKDVLNALDGIEIAYDHRTRGYWMKTDGFEPYELRLIVDSIQSSKFITQNVANRITAKVLSLTDRNTSAGLNRRSFVAGRIRSMNDSVVKDADNLHIAIQTNRKVRFKYFHYDREKKKWYSHNNEAYVVSPFGLLWNDGNYYLYAYDGEKFRHFRVDRMEHITVYPEPREGAEAFKRIDLNAHQAEVFNMFTGTETTVKLRCANHLADVILEQFGKDTMLIPDGEDDFTVSVPVQISKPFYAWAAGFGADMKILFPQAIVNEMRAFIQELSEMYKDDGLSSGRRFCDTLRVCVHLCQRRKSVKALGNVRIIDIAIMLCHFQRRVSQQLLERERISSAVHQVFPGKGMTEQMNRRFFDPSAVIVVRNRKTQSIFRQHSSVFITE